MSEAPFTRLILAIGVIVVILAPIDAHDRPVAAVPSAKSHPVSIIDADVFVNRFKTTIRMRFFAEDLALIQGMQPDEGEIYSHDLILEYFDDHRSYLLENIQIRDKDGELIKGRILEINDANVPMEGVDAGQLMNVTLGMVVEYPYDAPPEFLTIVQDVADPDYLFPSEVKVIVKQSGADSARATILKPQMPETFRFAWSDANSAAESEEMTAEWFDEARESADLGIESYSSVYSFLYITRREVRHEILVPLASLAATADIKFNNRDRNFLEIDEQDAIKPVIEKYFVEGNPIVIDGIEVKPTVERIDFYGLDVRDFVIQAERKRVSMASGRVGIMLNYSTKGPPNEVRLTWNRFSQSMSYVESVIFPYDDAARTKFARYLPENTYVWTSPGTPPLPQLTEIENSGEWWSLSEPGAALVLLGGLTFLAGIFGMMRPVFISPSVAFFLGLVIAGVGTLGIYQQWPRLRQIGPTIDTQTASSVFQQLHKNIFRAFDYHDDESIYDALAASVDGPFLRETYKKINERLKMQDQGGAVSRIDEIEVLDGEMIPMPDGQPKRGFDYRCTWKLVGSIEHWGHIHQRSIVYDAIFHVEPRDKAWKITSMDIVDEQPPEIRTSVRKLKPGSAEQTETAGNQAPNGEVDEPSAAPAQATPPSGSEF